MLVNTPPPPTKSNGSPLSTMYPNPPNKSILTQFGLGFLRVARLGAGWGGGGGRKLPAAYNCKTINDNEMKFGAVVKNH